MKNSILKTIKKMVNHRFIIEKKLEDGSKDTTSPLMAVFINEEAWKSWKFVNNSSVETINGLENIL